MNEHLRDRILRKLDTLNDERGYQILDYVEFLESKYAQRQTPPGNAFTRFTEAVEDRLRAGKVSAAAISETMGLLNRAANILNGAVAAGRSVANDIVSAATPSPSSMPPRGPGGTTAAPSAGAPPSPPPAATAPPVQPKEASSPAHDVEKPGSGEERL